MPMENDAPSEATDAEAILQRKEAEFLDSAFKLLESTRADRTEQEWTWDVVNDLFLKLEQAYDPDFYVTGIVQAKGASLVVAQKRRDDLMLERQRLLARAFMNADRALCLRYADVLRKAPLPPGFSEEERRAGFLDIVNAATDFSPPKTMLPVAAWPPDRPEDVRGPRSLETVVPEPVPDKASAVSVESPHALISADCDTITWGGFKFRTANNRQRAILQWYRMHPQNPENLSLQEIAVGKLHLNRRNSDLSRVFPEREIRALLFEPVKEFSGTYRMAKGVAFLPPVDGT